MELDNENPYLTNRTLNDKNATSDEVGKLTIKEDITLDKTITDSGESSTESNGTNAREINTSDNVEYNVTDKLTKTGTENKTGNTTLTVDRNNSENGKIDNTLDVKGTNKSTIEENTSGNSNITETKTTNELLKFYELNDKIKDLLYEFIQSFEDLFNNFRSISTIDFYPKRWWIYD